MHHLRKLVAGSAIFGLVVGSLLALAAGSGAAPAPASVTIVHGIPSVGAVDVCANGSTALVTGAVFKDVATISVPAGTYDLTVKSHATTACTGATLITLNGATVPAGANLSVVASLTGGSPKLDVFSNPTAAVAAGRGRVAVYHAANAPAVDILVNGSPGITGLAPGAVKSADLPTASYDFGVTAAGTTTPVLLNLPGVTVPAGKLLQVFAVGQPDNSDEPFQVITHTMALTTTAPSTTMAPSTTVPPTTMAPTAPAAPVNSSPTFTG